MKRDIFRYHDGTKERYCDPLKALRAMVRECHGDLAGVVENCKSPSPELAASGAEKFIAAGRVAFEMTPFNAMTGEGAMDEDVLSVLGAFWAFLEKKNATPANLPTSVPASA